MKNGRRPIVKAFSIPDSLGHCLGYVQPLHPLALDMYSRQAGQVRFLPVALSAARFNTVAVSLKDVGQLDLTGAAFAL